MAAIDQIEPAIKQLVLEDLGDDRPSKDEWNDWCRAKALRYGITEKQVRLIVQDRQVTMELTIRENAQKIAQRAAKFYAVNVAKAVKTVEDGLEATVCHIRTNKNGEVTAKIYEPDWRARLSAADTVFKVTGGYAPQQVHVEHDVSENLKEIKTSELKARMAELFLKAQKEDPEFAENIRRKQLQDAEVQSVERTGGRVPATSAGAGSENGGRG